MTYPPQPESHPPVPPPGAMPADPSLAYPPPPQPGFHPPAPGWPGGPPPAPPSGPGFAVAAMVLGLIGLVLPFLPVDLSGVRQFIALPFALPGLVLAIIGCIGPRKGKPLAVVGGIVSGLALILEAIMLFNYLR